MQRDDDISFAALILCRGFTAFKRIVSFDLFRKINRHMSHRFCVSE